MNSIDAVSSRIVIDVTDTQFSIKDDGHGIETKENILNFWGKFGTPHTEGDAIFGTYRMGRGQLMSFGTNRWRTGMFTMDVDIKNKGLEYVLQETPDDVFSGCHVTGTWYDKLLPSELDSLAREFKDMAAYAQIPVIYNGKQINQLPKEQEWDLETDDAYIKLRESGGLAVYNLGVLVCVYPAYQFGTGGVVVSKKQLQVNFARNEILQNKCNAWKSISKSIKSIAVTNMSSKKTRITEDERIALGRMILGGELDWSEARIAKVITDGKGGHCTLDDLARLQYQGAHSKLLTFAVAGSQVGETLHRRKLAFVISEATLLRFDAKTPEQFFDNLERIAEIYAAKERFFHDGKWFKQIRETYIPFSEASESMVDTHDIIESKLLTPRERMILPIINRLYDDVSRRMAGSYYGRRKLLIGTSEVAQAWTDGKSYIALHRNLLNEVFKGGYGAMFNVAGIIVHELLHDKSDQGSHVHDLEFYETWHNLMLDGIDGYRFACRYSEDAMLRMARVFRDADKKVPRNTLTVLDTMAKTHSTPTESTEAAPVDVAPAMVKTKVVVPKTVEKQTDQCELALG